MFSPQRVDYTDPQSLKPAAGFAAVDPERQVTIVLFAGDPGFGRCLYISQTRTLELTFDKTSHPNAGYCEIFPAWRRELRAVRADRPLDDDERARIDRDMSDAPRTSPTVFAIPYIDIRISP